LNPNQETGMRIDTLALALGGLCFLGFGAVMLVSPQAAMASLGLVLPDGPATTEIRSFYGGLELGLGMLLLAALQKVQYRRAGLVLGCVTYGSIAGAAVSCGQRLSSRSRWRCCSWSR
jgi:hypothetical protein